MIPYEVYFYSSGAIEERWGPKDLGLNRANALIGYGLGGLLSFALMISAGALLLPQGINAELLGTVALVAQAPLGQIGLILALVGILFAVSGAAIDSAFAGAYSLAQFFGWEWGKYRHNAGAPRFTLAWIVMLVLGVPDRRHRRRPDHGHRVLGDLLGRRPAAHLHPDPARRQRPRLHGRATRTAVLANIFGVFYLVVVLVIAVAAIPLLVLSNMGQRMTRDRSRPRHPRPPADGQRGPPLRERRRPRARGCRAGEPRVVAILTGPPAWRGRGVFGRLAASIARGELVRIPWEEVRRDRVVRRARARPAKELRLGRGDDRLRPWIEKIPGS